MSKKNKKAAKETIAVASHQTTDVTTESIDKFSKAGKDLLQLSELGQQLASDSKCPHRTYKAGERYNCAFCQSRFRQLEKAVQADFRKHPQEEPEDDIPY